MKTYETDYGTFSCFENDYYFVKSFSDGKVFDQELVERELTPYIMKANTILDIGAHIGCHTIMYSKINPNANIYSFEPQSKLFSLLDANLKANDIKNVTILNNAVGNEVKRVHMSNYIADGPNNDKPLVYDGYDQNIGGLSLGRDGEEVSMITVDSLALTECDFIKIDVEGAEKMVIAGAMNTIKKFKPTIFYECNHKKIASLITLTSHDMIRSLGDYEICEIGEDNFIAIFNPL